MKKLIVVIFLFTIFLLPITLACKPDSTPHFNIRTSEVNICTFSSYNEELSLDSSVIEFIANKSNSRNCDNLILTVNDEEIFRNVINQFNKGRYPYATINIVKQSDEEFLSFQAETEKTNRNVCDCRGFSNVTRYDDWTVYVSSMNCDFDSNCQHIPPQVCIENPTTQFLIIVTLIIAVIISLFIFKKAFRSKKVKK